MREAAKGDTVLVDYTGTLSDGSEFDSSAGRKPIELTIGKGEVIPGFESALVGMTEGGTKSVTLEPDVAYGPHNPQLVQRFERARISDDVNLKIGAALQTTDADGNRIPLMVVDVDDENVTVDANHPLAGKKLNFVLQLVGFVDQ